MFAPPSTGCVTQVVRGIECIIRPLWARIRSSPCGQGTKTKFYSSCDTNTEVQTYRAIATPVHCVCL